MNTEELLSQVEKVKISIVMQVNLSDYPGARADAVNKFRRAVNSFKNQIYKNAELIIVADGCNRAHQIYSREYSEETSIKFLYIDRTGTPKMYEETPDGKYYRGFPRRAGVGIATGDLITYMDSDDFLLPQFTMTLMLMYNSSPESDWWINSTWYDNEAANWEDSSQLFKTDHSNDISIEGLSSRWTQTRVKPGMGVLSPWLFMHKASCTTKWRDTIGGSEDSDFNRRLRQEYPVGMAFERPIYVRCHYSEKWDV